MTDTMPLAHLKIAFTGTFRKVRSEVEREAMLAGAQVHDRVKSDTDWLVVAKRPGRKKKEAAARFGVRVISENDFGAELTDGTVNIEPTEAKAVPCLDWVDQLANGRCVEF